MKRTKAIGNELDLLRGEMLNLSSVRHDPNDTEGKLHRETQEEWWGRKGGVILVRLENLRRAAVGLSSELVGREFALGIEDRVRVLLARMISEWIPMLRPGDWTEAESVALNDIDRELDTVARILREAAMPTDLIGKVAAAEIVGCSDKTIARRVKDGDLMDYAGKVSKAEVQAKKHQLSERVPRAKSNKK